MKAGKINHEAQALKFVGVMASISYTIYLPVKLLFNDRDPSVPINDVAELVHEPYSTLVMSPSHTPHATSPNLGSL
jgi:hypothetical protein